MRRYRITEKALAQLHLLQAMAGRDLDTSRVQEEEEGLVSIELSDWTALLISEIDGTDVDDPLDLSRAIEELADRVAVTGRGG